MTRSRIFVVFGVICANCGAATVVVHMQPGACLTVNSGVMNRINEVERKQAFDAFAYKPQQQFHTPTKSFAIDRVGGEDCANKIT